MDPLLQIAFALLVLVFLTLAVVGVGMVGWGAWFVLNRLLGDRPHQAVTRWWLLVVRAVRSARARSRSES